MANVEPTPFRPSALFRARHSRRGLLMAEVLIASAIGAMITGVVVWLMYESALAVKDIYAETRTRATRMVALDQVRYKLADAHSDSIVISNSNRTIQFQDANQSSGVTSQFTFVPDDPADPDDDHDQNLRVLWYDEDISVNEAGEVPGLGLRVARGPIDFTFERSGFGIVRLLVKSAADVSFGDVDEQDGETLVYLRNV